MNSFCIIGLGPVGASFGLALKQNMGAKTSIRGFDFKRGRARKALKAGAIDRDFRNLPAALEGADLVFLDIPANEFKDFFEHLPDAISGECIVTDTASTKGELLKWADEMLPESVSFIGGHPLIGLADSDIEEPDPDLFRGQTYCLIPAGNAASGALEIMINLVKMIGARPFLIDALEHDAYVAGCDHLPILLSHALASAISKTPAWNEMSEFATDRFYDFCRPALKEPQSVVDICLTNRGSALRWLDEYIEELQRLKSLVSTETDGLKEILEETNKEIEARLTKEKLPGRGPMGPPPIEKEGMMSMLLGSQLTKKFTSLWKPIPPPEEDEKDKKIEK